MIFETDPDCVEKHFALSLGDNGKDDESKTIHFCLVVDLHFTRKERIHSDLVGIVTNIFRELSLSYILSVVLHCGMLTLFFHSVLTFQK